MRSNLTYLVVVAAMLSVATGWSFLQEAPTGVRVTQSAKAFVATLSPEQKSTAVLPADSPQRVDWHVIPKAQRKGLQFKDMNDAQRQAALDLLRSVLSPTGYDKATKVMALEAIIRELEKARGGGPIRDPERYYFTLFGEPSEVGRWGLSIEGHHLSLNFLVDSGRVIAATPLFLAANPNVVRQGMPGNVPAGTRTLAEEELLGFQLLESLDAQQRKTAILDAKAPRDVRAAGEPQSPAYATDGLSFAGMNETQRKLLKKLIGVYLGNLPTDLAAARLHAIEEAGYDKVYFAWAGADRPGIGHYYRIQGPTFLIEFVNTQSDSARNPASHIHSFLRDPTGDFAIPAKRSSKASLDAWGVRRPAEIVRTGAAGAVQSLLGELLQDARFQVDPVVAQRIVGVGDPLAIGRPDRVLVKAAAGELVFRDGPPVVLALEIRFPRTVNGISYPRGAESTARG